MDNILIDIIRNQSSIDESVVKHCRRFYNKATSDVVHELIKMKNPGYILNNITKTTKMYINQHCNNPCNYCKTYTNVDYISIDIPKLPYYGYHYPHMNFHLACLIPIVDYCEAFILNNGYINYKKIIYNYLVFTNTYLIIDVIRYIGLFYGNLLK